MRRRETDLQSAGFIPQMAAIAGASLVQNQDKELLLGFLYDAGAQGHEPSSTVFLGTLIGGLDQEWSSHA